MIKHWPTLKSYYFHKWFPGISAEYSLRTAIPFIYLEGKESDILSYTKTYMPQRHD